MPILGDINSSSKEGSVQVPKFLRAVGAPAPATEEEEQLSSSNDDDHNDEGESLETFIVPAVGFGTVVVY